MVYSVYIFFRLWTIYCLVQPEVHSNKVNQKLKHRFVLCLQFIQFFTNVCKSQCVSIIVIIVISLFRQAFYSASKDIIRA